MVTKNSKMYTLSELELNPTIKKIGGCYSIKIKYGKKLRKISCVHWNVCYYALIEDSSVNTKCT